MLLISPNFDVKSIIFSQFWPGAFSQIAGKSPDLSSDTYIYHVQSIVCVCVFVHMHLYVCVFGHMHLCVRV